MPASDPTRLQPSSSWLQRFAGRLIQKQPGTMPLDAVRHGLEVFPAASELEPEEAADTVAGEAPHGDVGTSK